MQKVGITLVLLVSFLLNFACLGREGLANLYYAAGVKSMMMSWHNFFFVSSDPGGFITIDKPPLGFWLQTLSAKIFGFEGWSIILPQALGGVLSVYLIYVLVKRAYGEGAGLISALVLALTPIFVAASRNNTIDVLLVTVVLWAALVFLQATEEASFRKLLVAFFLIGVGFNIKSLEAYMVLPAFYITYLLAPKRSFKTKVVQLLVATFILLASSLPWFAVVDSIAADERPYVGSSETNSELELATGYNGLSHFLGYGIRTPGKQTQIQQPSSPRLQAGPGTGSGSFAGNARQRGGETGLPGTSRLFNHQLGGQISWVLPFALLGIIVAIYQFWRKTLPEKSRMNLLFWGSWLIPEMIFFSIAQGAHRYYLVMMAPSIAALVGISYMTFVNWSRGPGKRCYFLPLALLVTVGVQALIIVGYTEWRWMLAVVVGAGAIAAILLGWQAQNSGGQKNKYHHAMIFAGVMSLSIAPFAWSLTPMLYGSGNAAFPFAGPDLNSQTKQAALGGSGNLSGRFTVDTGKLESFLMAHRKGERYIIAVPNAHVASPIILDTGEPVITYGGFMGSEKILNINRLEDLVSSGQVRYILISSDKSQQPDVDEWVIAHGILVPDGEWQTKSDQEGSEPKGAVASPRRDAMHLYECAAPKV